MGGVVNIKNEMDCIDIEFASIVESQERIKEFATEICKYNPLSVGSEYVVNGWSHKGKTMVADKVFVSDRQGKDVLITANKPVNFTAIGTVKRADGSLGAYSGSYDLNIEEFIKNSD